MERKPPDLYSGHVKEFFDLIFSYIRQITLKILDAPEFRTRFQESFATTIYGIKSNTSGEFRHTPIDLFITNKLFRPFSEISESYESLLNIRAYISSFPIRDRTVSKLAYLRYHIENYLNELYILKVRLVSFLTVIERTYKNSPEHSYISNITDILKTLIDKTLEGHIEVRGAHVHEIRYDDKDLARLSSLDLLTKGPNDSFSNTIMSIFDIVYKQTRTKWRKRILDDLNQLHSLLDIYFENLLKIIKTNDELLLPASLRPKENRDRSIIIGDP